jgi:hypothetical protein
MGSRALVIVDASRVRHAYGPPLAEIFDPVVFVKSPEILCYRD